MTQLRQGDIVSITATISSVYGSSVYAQVGDSGASVSLSPADMDAITIIRPALKSGDIVTHRNRGQVVRALHGDLVWIAPIGGSDSWEGSVVALDDVTRADEPMRPAPPAAPAEPPMDGATSSQAPGDTSDDDHGY